MHFAQNDGCVRVTIEYGATFPGGSLYLLPLSTCCCHSENTLFSSASDSVPAGYPLRARYSFIGFRVWAPSRSNATLSIFFTSFSSLSGLIRGRMYLPSQMKSSCAFFSVAFVPETSTSSNQSLVTFIEGYTGGHQDLPNKFQRKTPKI